MTKTSDKIVLSRSRDIPFDKLVLSQANVRGVKAGVSIDELAEDIAQRTLLQSLSVRPVLDAEGQETGMFEVPAGGRRFRALERLVAQKRLARTAPVPCVVRTEGLAEADSLAENVQRAPLHPLDQFRAFAAMREKGLSEEEIAAAFFISVNVVRQRLKLVAVSPKLLDAYAEDELTLDELMAFTVNPDHERQQLVFARLRASNIREPFYIRRLLTEGAVRACDKRAQFVGVEAYCQAGGALVRDLFHTDDGGWLQDVALLDRLVAEKLEREAEAVRAEGWKWVEPAVDLPYGYTFGLRRLRGEQPALTEEQERARVALKAEYDAIEAQFGDADELTEDADQRLSEIETALAAIHDQPERFSDADREMAGAYVTLGPGGRVSVERGFVRPEHDPARAAEAQQPQGEGASAVDSVEAEGPPRAGRSDLAEGPRPLPDRLLADLTAHRTIALRLALGENAQTARLCVLHALALKLFYVYGHDSCLQVEAKSSAVAHHAPDLNDTAAAQALIARHERWRAELPKNPHELWDTLLSLDHDSGDALFAHCAAMTLDAVQDAWGRRPQAIAHADRVAAAVGLDMAVGGWRPTAQAFFGRLTKACILAAVGEGCGAAHAERIAHLKKEEMAEAAEALMAESGWLPPPLRTRGVDPRPLQPRDGGVPAEGAIAAE